MTIPAVKTQGDGEVTRRWLLKSSGLLTVGIAALGGVAAEVPAITAAVESAPQMTEEMARHFTTF
jgi:predicted benzoate:H+ symporter BenE